LWISAFFMLISTVAMAADPVLDTSTISLGWVLTEGMKLVGILVVVVCGVWGLRKLKNLGA